MTKQNNAFGWIDRDHEDGFIPTLQICKVGMILRNHIRLNNNGLGCVLFTLDMVR